MNPMRINQYIKPTTQFPPAWLWLVDEAIPNWVKKEYSPRESWKNKPFSKEDARFFFKGIEELSDLFTEERPKGMPNYFQHPKYRSSYLLYFLPLQAAKFLTLFQLYPHAIEAALSHGRKTGTLRIADIGAGPGTASLALLLLLMNLKMEPGQEIPPIEITLVDTNPDIMADGKALIEQLSSSFPKLRGRIQLKTHILPWWKAASHIPDAQSLILLGHVLNEASAPQRDSHSFWELLLKKAEGGGVLMAEPATRKSGQLLSSLRNHFFESGLIENTPSQIWGPCLHAGTCPLTRGRDWCHASVPIDVPGKWFRDISAALGSEKHWVKFTYLWLASSSYPSPKPYPQLRRVISDPLSQGPKSTVLICEPEVAGRFPVLEKQRVGRGDIVKI